MQKKVSQNKDFRTIWTGHCQTGRHAAMQNTKHVSELLSQGSVKLRALKDRLKDRHAVLTQVRAALPPKIAQHVETAGIEQGRLSIGTSAAVWASRLRYLTDELRKQVGAALGVDILTVKIRIVPPPPDGPSAAPPAAKPWQSPPLRRK